jgi:hypothetical protein
LSSGRRQEIFLRFIEGILAGKLSVVLLWKFAAMNSPTWQNSKNASAVFYVDENKKRP